MSSVINARLARTILYTSLSVSISSPTDIFTPVKHDQVLVSEYTYYILTEWLTST